MDEQHVSPAIRLWRYFRTKGRNAWWVLKTKGVRGVWRNLTNEVLWLCGRYTIHQANADPGQVGNEAKPPKVPDSAFCDRRRLVPPSPRPTRALVLPTPPLAIDRAAIGHALRSIKEELRNSSAIQGKLHHDDH